MRKLRVASRIAGLIMVSLVANLAYAETAEEPLMIRKIMQAMQSNIIQIEQGIDKQDWDLVSQNALAVAGHPAPPLFEKLRIFAYINTDLGEFKKLDKKTHETAKILGEMALKDDKSNIVTIVAELKESCEQCHQAFRQEFQENFYD